MEDLFEKYEELPQEVQDILTKYNDVEDYQGCDKLVKELNAVGYTCDYGLDASPYDLRKLDIEGQKILFEEIVSKTNINIVTCGDCGNIVFHRTPTEEIECPHCGMKSEPCDFPDFYY